MTGLRRIGRRRLAKVRRSVGVGDRFTGLEGLEPRLLLSISALPDSYTLAQGQTLYAYGYGEYPPGVLANDVGVSNAFVDTPPANPTFYFYSNGAFEYSVVNRPNFIGTDSFTYRASAGGSTYLNLVDYSTTWLYYHPLNGRNPVISDTDFDSTWYYNDARYNGPAFSSIGQGLMGYGSIDYGPLTTNIGTPPSGSRYTAYFKTTFTIDAPEDVLYLYADILADDGAYIYLNGQLATTVNVPASAASDTYGQFANGTNNENGNTEQASVFRQLDPSPLVAGQNVLAVSLHNADAGSSDLAMQMQIWGEAVSSTPPTLVQIEVTDAHVPLIVQGDVFSVEYGQVLLSSELEGGGARSVFDNDDLFDEEAQPFDPILEVVLDTSAMVGELFFDEQEGYIAYIPPEGFSGIDRFTYTLIDKDGASAPATVTITVLPGDEPPVGMDDALTYEGGTVLRAEVTRQFETVIARGGRSFEPGASTPWKYLADGSDQADAWRLIGFDDSAWPTGYSEMGYGDGDERWYVGYVDASPADGEQKNATTYFRHEFEVADPGQYDELIVRVKYDDGGALYLNGVEIARANLDANARFDTYATAETPDEDAFFEFRIGAGLLRSGTNLLAAEIHQVSPTSSDISFDLEMVGVRIVGNGGVLANDHDANGDALSVSLVTVPMFHNRRGGATPFVLNADGSFVYDPVPDAGPDSFTYLLTDGRTTVGPMLVTLTPTFSRLSPAGSLIFASRPYSGQIAAAGQMVEFPFEIDAGQTLTAIVRPGATLAAHVELRDPQGQVIGSTESAAGVGAVLQTIATDPSGVYTVRVSGGGTTGTFDLRMLLNAAAEEESVNGSINDGAEIAQDLSDSFIALNGNGATRGAVVNLYDTFFDPFEDWYTFTADDGQVLSLVLEATFMAGFPPTMLSLDLYDPQLNPLAAGMAIDGDTTSIGSYRDATSDGQPQQYFVRVSGLDSAYRLVVTRSAQLDVEPNDRPQQAIDITATGVALGSTRGGIAGVNDTDRQQWSNFPLILTDGGGFTWDIFPTGTVDDGSSDAFNGAMRVDDYYYSEQDLYREHGGREVSMGPRNLYSVADVTLARKIFVPQNRGFARYLDVLHNPSGEPRTFEFRIDSSLGSYDQTRIAATPDGASRFTESHAWVVTDDGTDGQSGRPVVAHVIGGEDGSLAPRRARVESDVLNYTYEVTLEPGESAAILHFAVQAPDGQTGIGTAQSLAKLELGALEGLSDEEIGLIRNFFIGQRDVYQVQANAGDMLAVATDILDRGPHEFHNRFTPVIELRAVTGELLAMNVGGAPDGVNAMLSYPVATSGSYYIAIHALEGVGGEYVLNVTGHTGGAALPQIVSSLPGDGVFVGSFPASLTLRWSQPLDADSVSASDLTVNGVSATGVTFADAYTTIFDVDPAANSGAGTYLVEISAGAILDADGDANSAIARTFEFDNQGPRLVALRFNGQPLPAEGRLTAGSQLVLDMTFNEPLSADIAQTIYYDAIVLRERSFGNYYYPTAIAYDPASFTLTAHFDYLIPDGRYTLNVYPTNYFYAQFRGIEDANGLLFDGEANPDNSLDGTPSGDSVPGGPFELTFGVESGPFEIIDGWGRTGILGSRTFERYLGDRINYVNDVDAFTMFLGAGETIQAYLNNYDGIGQLEFTMRLLDPTGGVVAENTNLIRRYETLVMPAVRASMSGVYTLEVMSPAVDSYFEIRLVRNGQAEGDDQAVVVLQPIVPSAWPNVGTLFTAQGTTGGELLPNTALYSVEPATGRILRIQAQTGDILGSFPAPDALMPDHTRIGLALAEDGNALLYVNADVDAARLYRLSPLTGAVLSTVTQPSGSYDGLGWFKPDSRVIAYQADMSSDPGWTYQGFWAYGQTNGMTAPHSGATGTGVVATVVNGLYPIDQPQRQYVTTGPIDTRGLTGVTLNFQRFLRSYHEATIEVSINGSTWQEVFHGYGQFDDEWTPTMIDLSSIADDRATVYIRWGLGPVDGYNDLPGWNIDDVSVYGYQSMPSYLFLSDSDFAMIRRSGVSGVSVAGWTFTPPHGAIGADGSTRAFGLFADGLIHEFDPANPLRPFLATFTPPAADVEGLAFDGTTLYASTASGMVFMLDPNTGTVLHASQIASGHGSYALAMTGLRAGDGNPVTEVESNNTFALAQSLDGRFSLRFDPHINEYETNTSTTRPHVTVAGTGNNSRDFYKFTVANAGDVGVFDIDQTVNFNSYITLYDSAGNYLSGSDDFYGVDAGSSTYQDSFLTYYFSSPGVYYLEVGACCIANVPTGASYRLHVSIDNYGQPALPAGNPQSLISFGDEWRFLDNGSNQGTAWRDPDYDDAGWSVGQGQFGYGGDGEDTVVSFGNNPANKHVTTYFRKEFFVDDLMPFDLFNLSFLRDDGIAVYLNGVELVRDNLAGEAPFDMLAWNTIGDDPGLPSYYREGAVQTFTLAADSLVQGRNVIAVEIHQASLDSSDLAFDLSLEAASNPLAVADVDEYAVDLTGFIGESMDLLLGGASGPTQLKYTRLQLIDPDGQTILAEGMPTLIDPFSTGEGLAILDFIVPRDGVYTVRVSSPEPLYYHLHIPVGASFDVTPAPEEPGDVRNLTVTQRAIGALVGAASDETDFYFIDLLAGQGLTVVTATPYADNAVPGIFNDLDPMAVVLDPAGHMVAEALGGEDDGKNVRFNFIAPMDGWYLIGVGGQPFAYGEYVLHAIIDDDLARGDVNGDGFVDAADIDALDDAVRSEADHPLLDLNLDGVIDPLDKSALVEDILKTAVGDTTVDRRVTIRDLANVAAHFGMTNVGWGGGDFNGDRRVTIRDLADLAAHFGYDNTAVEAPLPADHTAAPAGAASSPQPLSAESLIQRGRQVIADLRLAAASNLSPTYVHIANILHADRVLPSSHDPQASDDPIDLLSGGA